MVDWASFQHRECSASGGGRIKWRVRQRRQECTPRCLLRERGGWVPRSITADAVICSVTATFSRAHAPPRFGNQAFLLSCRKLFGSLQLPVGRNSPRPPDPSTRTLSSFLVVRDISWRKSFRGESFSLWKKIRSGSRFHNRISKNPFAFHESGKGSKPLSCTEVPESREREQGVGNWGFIQ
jgi:hypothetical protein